PGYTRRSQILLPIRPRRGHNNCHTAAPPRGSHMTAPENGSVGRTAPEHVLDRFEQARRSREPPCIEDFLTPSSAQCSRVLLVELVRTDLEHRLKIGQPARVEDYLARFPELGRTVDDLIELVVAEYRFRGRLGQQPSTDEYLQRFPHHHP